MKYILDHPFAVCIVLSGTILISLVALRSIHVFYRIFVSMILTIACALWMSRTPSEGKEDFFHADTRRILAGNHYILQNWIKESGSCPPAGNKGFDELKFFDSKIYYMDAWGHALQYDVVAGHGIFRSAGRDGVFGTKDDLQTQ